MPRYSNKRKPPPKRCGCRLTCNYYLLRCDSCHRGLFDPVADRPNVYVCTSCKNNGVEEARVLEIRAAEGRPCSVVFRGSCQYHCEDVSRGHKILPLADDHSDEVISDADCDICYEYFCRNISISCNKCHVFWHTHCVPMTPAMAERIDKWYCERCRKTEPLLQIIFKDGHRAEEGGNDNVTPPPGPSSGASASVPAAQRKKRPAATTDDTARPTKRAALDDRAAKTEPSAEVPDAQAEQPAPVEAPANPQLTVEDLTAVVDGPSTPALVEQLKQAADRIRKLEGENAILLREKAAAMAAKEGQQKALDETKAELAKKNVLIAHLTAKLVDAGQL